MTKLERRKLMAKTYNNVRVTHTKTGRTGVCKGPSNTHRNWYNILWDGETHCYRYTRDEFKVQEESPKDSSQV
jgi:hypothetical protein